MAGLINAKIGFAFFYMWCPGQFVIKHNTKVCHAFSRFNFNPIDDKFFLVQVGPQSEIYVA